MLVESGLFPVLSPNLSGRFTRHLGVSKASRSWVSLPSTRTPIVSSARNFKEGRASSKVASGGVDFSENERDNSSRKQAFLKKGVKNTAGDKDQLAGAPSLRTASAFKPPAQASSSVSEEKRWRSGDETLDGSQTVSWRVKGVSKQPVAQKIVIAGSDSPKPVVRSSKQSNCRSSTETVAPLAGGVGSEFELDTGVSTSFRASASLQRETIREDTMNSQQYRDPKQQANERKGKQNMDRKPKQPKEYPVEAVLRRELNMCSKDGDVFRALEIYNRSLTEGTVKWNQYNFNILLYLCSSAALGTLTARKSGTDRPDAERLNFESTHYNTNGEERAYSTNGRNGTNGKHGDAGSNGTPEVPVNGDGNGSIATAIVLSPEDMEIAAKRGFEIYEEMKRQQVPPNEATLTAVARLAVKRGDGDLAFQMVKEMSALNIAPKLRSFSPALVTYCKAREVEKAFLVDAHMLSVGVQPEEPELGALLQLCVELGMEKEVYSLLHRLRMRIRELSPASVASIEQWFSGKPGFLAGRGNIQPDPAAVRKAVVAGGGGWHGLGWLGRGEWKTKWTHMDAQGVCSCCKERLVTIDLDPEETEKFAQSVSRLAFARESKHNEFRKFQDWLREYGPFDAVVDGANVGLYNQNFAQGGFNFFQLNAVVQAAQDRSLAKRPPLVILHQARTKYGAANSPLGQQLLQRWASSNSIYTTPSGSNDDWYWMYAAVSNKCFLITNDEMRDHIFQLLGTDFFPKWKERHQVRFTATTRGPQFHLPPPYSLVIQESETGSWHIPKAGGNDIDSPREWLCVTRPGLPDSVSEPIPEERVKVTTQTSSRVRTSEGIDRGATPVELSSLESSWAGENSNRVKRSRVNSPSRTLRMIASADKRSENGPITFEI